MGNPKRVLLKLTGAVFSSNGLPSPFVIRSLAQQISALRDSLHISIVVGGGNFFRGKIEGVAFGLTPGAGHECGMLATVMNGIILRTIFAQEGVPATLLNAIALPSFGIESTAETIIAQLCAELRCIIFSGGTGVPFFTTDTAAVVRALQINADEIWKGTNVDGIYNEDPHHNPKAHRLAQVTYTHALTHQLGILDTSAYALAQQHGKVIRIFNIFEKNALINAATDNSYGSIIKE